MGLGRGKQGWLSSGALGVRASLQRDLQPSVRARELTEHKRKGLGARRARLGGVNDAVPVGEAGGWIRVLI